MKEITVKVYSFDELSEEAKQTAIQNYRNKIDEIHWADENRESIEKFAEIFPIKIRDWSYGGRGEGVSFYFDTDRDEIEELSGQRLATYIWNNYRRDLFKGNYYGHLSEFDKFGNKIPISKEHPIGKRHVKRHSKILFNRSSCPFTGYYMDDVLLKPIYDFLDKPTDTTFRELLEECFQAWIDACNNDIEYQQSDEYIAEEIKNNDYEFTEEGERF